MDLLRKPLFVDVEMRGSGRLFNEFTLVLDQILLQAFDKLHVGDNRISINLNVESVFTEAFEGIYRKYARRSHAPSRLRVPASPTSLKISMSFK